MNDHCLLTQGPIAFAVRNEIVAIVARASTSL